ncbi:MAG: hypothetical protein JKY70_05540 [Mucilaginibacter sp.]|nr:hypothetical protein [Mucilaginibacter sp.]
MKHFLLSWAALMLLSISASAQGGYSPGYYINLKGDTIRGVIDHREWSSNPESIDFKANAQASGHQQLSPSLIREFAIQGDNVYQSYTGMVSADVIGNSNGRDTSFTEKSVFLKLLNRGDKLTLFEYTDRFKTRFFIKATGATAAELIYRSYQQNEQTIDERTYRKQLSVIASQNNKLSDEVNNLIQHTEYNDDALTKVIRKINDVTDDSAAPSAQGKSIGFYAGIHANMMMYKPGFGIEEAGAPNKSSVLPAIAAGINVYVNPRIKQVVLRVEGGMAMGRYNGAYKSLVSPYNDVIFKFNQLNIYLAPQILYNAYNDPDFKFFIGAGMQGYLINYSGREFRSADGSPSQLATQPFGFFVGTGTAILFKTGFVINKKIEINAGYTLQSDISQDAYYLIKATGANLGVNYLF